MVGLNSPMKYLQLQEQDKSSDFEQQSPFGDRKYSNTLPQKKGGGYKTNRNIIFRQSMKRYSRRIFREKILIRDANNFDKKLTVVIPK